MLSYNLMERRLANLKNPLFFLKTIIFKVHSQRKLLTEKVDSLS